MRTNLTQSQVSAIIADYFERNDSSVNFLHYGCDPEDGGFNGCLVDHSCEVPIPGNFEDWQADSGATA